jgi:hypothetical protein
MEGDKLRGYMNFVGVSLENAFLYTLLCCVLFVDLSSGFVFAADVLLPVVVSPYLEPSFS